MAEPSERELLHELTAITKDKTAWPQSISFVSSLLFHPSVKVKAKALWLLGEMGLLHPSEVGVHAPRIAAFLKDGNALLRERALNALGRIGRGDHGLVKPYFPQERVNYRCPLCFSNNTEKQLLTVSLGCLILHALGNLTE